MTPVQVGRARARDLDWEGVYGSLWESSYRSKPSQVVEEDNLLLDEASEEGLRGVFLATTILPVLRKRKEVVI